MIIPDKIKKNIVDIVKLCLYSLAVVVVFIAINAIAFRTIKNMSVLNIAIITTVLLSACAVAVYQKLFKKTILTGFILFIAYVCGFIVFSIFTSVYFDRSLTYHMMFYAYEHGGMMSTEEINSIMKNEAYAHQRIREMENAGYVKSYGGGVGGY